jgi:alkylation response protein AidB-like acyl-CoA dehydrogenase
LEFRISEEQEHLRQRCLSLAADFASRSAQHDRDGSHPVENYDRLRQEGFLELTVPKSFGGRGWDLLSHTIAYEALGQGCPSTALAFNMHTSVVMPLLVSPEVTDRAKQHIADLVVRQRRMIGGNFSEPGTTALVGARPLSVRASRVDGGYSITGRTAGMLLLIPRLVEGRSVIANWDTLGMRATRSDSLVLDKCWVPDSAVMFHSDDIRGFWRANQNWLWGSYTAVYLGLAVAAYDEVRRVVTARQPQGYAQSLAYHPDVRRHIAKMSADLQAARLVTYHSAWLSDTQGLTAETIAALCRAKFLVGEAVSSITRTALTLGGAHGIFKGSRLEQLFRDGAIAEIQPPPTDACLWNMGVHELGLDPDEVLSALKSL